MIEQFELFDRNQFNKLFSESVEQNVTDSKKKSLNRNHYERNKSEILEKAKERYRRKKASESNVIPLFGSGSALERSDERPPSGNLRNKKPRIARSTFCFCALVAGFSSYLLFETSLYFAQSDSSIIGPIFKAMLLEGAVLAFWLKKPCGRLSAVFQRVMAILIYAYTLGIVSGTVFQSASHQQTEATISQKAILELESEIEKSTRLRDHYFEIDRITFGMKLDRTLAGLREKLEKVRAKIVQIPDREIIQTNLFIQIVFRVLIMISNLFVLNELARRHRPVSPTN